MLKDEKIWSLSCVNQKTRLKKDRVHWLMLLTWGEMTSIFHKSSTFSQDFMLREVELFQERKKRWDPSLTATAGFSSFSFYCCCQKLSVRCLCGQSNNPFLQRTYIWVLGHFSAFENFLRAVNLQWKKKLKLVYCLLPPKSKTNCTWIERRGKSSWANFACQIAAKIRDGR